MDIWRSFTSNLEFLVCLGRVIVNHGRGEGGEGLAGRRSSAGFGRREEGT